MENNICNNISIDDVAVITDVCEYFTEYPDRISRKLKNLFSLHNDTIDFCIVLRLIQKRVYKDKSLSVVIAKFFDQERKKLQTFKILVDVSLNPVVNSINFRFDERPYEEIEEEVNSRIINEGSFNQMICFTCKDEKMRGSGNYSVIICDATEAEIRNNHDLLRTRLVDDCPFCVID